MVTLAILHQCLNSLSPLSVVEPTQPTVLIPVHLCTASLAHREHFGADVSTAAGYCTARMACALMAARESDDLPEAMWNCVRGAAIATMTAAGADPPDQA